MRRAAGAAYAAHAVVVLAGLVAAASAAGCLRSTSFHCEDDQACAAGAVGGTCEDNGFCSVDDASCASGRRFGDHAGSLSGTCVGGASGDAGPLLDGGGDAAVLPATVAPLCSAGPPEPFASSPCTMEVCTAHPECCDTAWSDDCVRDAEVMCGADCSGWLALAVDGDNRVYRALPGGGGFEEVWRGEGGDGESVDVAWGDYDADGDMDLAFARLGAPSVVLRNDGVGRFAVAWETPVLDNILDVAWGDLDGDGFLDLAVSGVYIPATVYRYVGDVVPQDPFEPAWEAEEQDLSAGLAVGDLDDDLILDLVVGGRDNDTDSYLNVGDGTLAHGVVIGPVDDLTQDVAISDWDDDGDADVALANDGVSRIFENVDGSLVLSEDLPGDLEGRQIAFGDCDGDGVREVALAGIQRDAVRSRVLRWDGDAWVVAHQFAATSSSGLSWGDFDGDGDLDLALANGSLGASIERNGGNCNFEHEDTIDLGATDPVRKVAWAPAPAGR